MDNVVKKTALHHFGKLAALLAFAFISDSSLAVDATGRITDAVKFGKWQVLEFAADSQLIYRVGATSSNAPYMHIAFDFAPMIGCKSKSAVLILKLDEYDPVYDDGAFAWSYKTPGGKESTEFVSSAMSQGDTFAFFQFNHLTPALLQRSNGKGNLSIWMPPSGDGTIKRGPNIYFPLSGLPESIRLAQKKCKESI